ncbi:hypothetical protein BJF85_07130 [Saccharomonospora sp. CUA-673]|uniref:hypothetical protein n=1 Tax=Saccharomonospora sp. CUA-673 TaxID=1904969 RepID=UPI000966BDD6|nr:hypothetical protein [Saccharomonospora sp. CUA-673]OLT38998.1 hypothetical protein BJF85_07130 [Saccharomonospora sp. CUA-673]
MIPASPVEAFGSHAQQVRGLVVGAVHSCHARFAEAHQVSGSRYAMGFGSQWRDLLDDVQVALRGRGYRTYKLPPAGYKLPVVNDCLVYVWRVPDAADVATSFASSLTRVNGFSAPLLDPTLFEPGFDVEPESGSTASSTGEADLRRVVQASADVMPLVLVLVESSPRQLQSIKWAVAELDEGSGEVRLHGEESIWAASESNAVGGAVDVESFDSGAPDGPVIEPHGQEGMEPDA